MFGGWQIGHTDPITYAKKYDQYVRALKKTNNKLRFIAVGACSDHFGHWNEQVLKSIKEKILNSRYSFLSKKPKKILEQDKNFFEKKETQALLNDLDKIFNGQVKTGLELNNKLKNYKNLNYKIILFLSLVLIDFTLIMPATMSFTLRQSYLSQVL